MLTHSDVVVSHMADLLETLHTLARQRSRGESPLVAVRHFSERTGTRISHLAISQPLLQAWVGLTGEPFHQHQSLALAALRRARPTGRWDSSG